MYVCFIKSYLIRSTLNLNEMILGLVSGFEPRKFFIWFWHFVNILVHFIREEQPDTNEIMCDSKKRKFLNYIKLKIYTHTHNVHGLMQSVRRKMRANCYGNKDGVKVSRSLCRQYYTCRCGPCYEDTEKTWRSKGDMRKSNSLPRYYLH